MASPGPSCLLPNLKPSLGACPGGWVARWVTVGSWERPWCGEGVHIKHKLGCLCMPVYAYRPARELQGFTQGRKCGYRHGQTPESTGNCR